MKAVTWWPIKVIRSLWSRARHRHAKRPLTSNVTCTTINARIQCFVNFLTSTPQQGQTVLNPWCIQLYSLWSTSALTFRKRKFDDHFFKSFLLGRATRQLIDDVTSSDGQQTTKPGNYCCINGTKWAFFQSIINFHNGVWSRLQRQHPEI